MGREVGEKVDKGWAGVGEGVTVEAVAGGRQVSRHLCFATLDSRQAGEQAGLA